MSHEAHSHDTHATEKTHKAPLGSAFWFIVVLVGLFIGALNFVNVMGGEEAHGGGHEATKVHYGTHEGAELHKTEVHDPNAMQATPDSAAHAASATHDSSAQQGHGEAHH